MIALELKNTKSFMKHLLLSNTVDHFLFIEGEIVTFNTFTLDGYLQKNFFEPDTVPPHQYSSWGQIRELCFSIIKGKRTPLRFRFSAFPPPISPNLWNDTPWISRPPMYRGYI